MEVIIENSIRQQILERLRQFETEHSIKVLMAVESGSRSWGFPSKDSDYDIRFVYVQPQSRYLALNFDENALPLEHIFEGELDFSGWDLGKFLRLLYKSNMVAIEWAQPGILYDTQSEFPESLRVLSEKYLNPLAGAWHYLNMAQKAREKFEKNGGTIKSFFYMLRPLLACKWISEKQKPAPMNINDMTCLLPDHEQRLLSNLIAEKTKAQESSKIFLPPELLNRVSTWFEELNPPPVQPAGERAWEPLNRLMLEALES